MLEGYIADKFANKMFEKQAFQTVKIHAFTESLLICTLVYATMWTYLLPSMSRDFSGWGRH